MEKMTLAARRGLVLFPLALALGACASRTVEIKSPPTSAGTSEPPLSTQPLSSAAPLAGPTPESDPYHQAAGYARNAEITTKEDEIDSSKDSYSPPMWAAGVVLAVLLLGILIFL
jgi:hypothetical protein